MAEVNFAARSQRDPDSSRIGHDGRSSPGQCHARVRQRVARLNEFRNRCVEFGEVLRCNRLDLCARAVLILPEREQVPDLFNSEPRATRPMDKAQNLTSLCS